MAQESMLGPYRRPERVSDTATDTFDGPLGHPSRAPCIRGRDPHRDVPIAL